MFRAPIQNLSIERTAVAQIYQILLGVFLLWRSRARARYIPIKRRMSLVDRRAAGVQQGEILEDWGAHIVNQHAESEEGSTSSEPNSKKHSLLTVAMHHYRHMLRPGRFSLLRTGLLGDSFGY